MRVIIILLAISLVATYAEKPILPSMYFYQSQSPSAEEIMPFLGEYHSYVESEGRVAPPSEVYLENSKTCWLNPIFVDVEQKYSLKNSRFLEAILANGYHLNVVLQFTAEGYPTKAIIWNIRGYDRATSKFKGILDGRLTEIDYQHTTEYIVYAEIGDNSHQRQWAIQFVSKEYNTDISAHIEVYSKMLTITTSSLDTAIENAYNELCAAEPSFSEKPLLSCHCYFEPQDQDRDIGFSKIRYYYSGNIVIEGKWGTIIQCYTYQDGKAYKGYTPPRYYKMPGQVVTMYQHSGDQWCNSTTCNCLVTRFVHTQDRTLIGVQGNCGARQKIGNCNWGGIITVEYLK